jgi:hypothetical protein
VADREMVSVDANALRMILQALIGPPHHIREIQATRSIAALTGDDQIQTLLDDYNTAVVGGGPPRCPDCNGTGYAPTGVHVGAARALTPQQRSAALAAMCHWPGNNSDEMLNAMLDELCVAIGNDGVAEVHAAGFHVECRECQDCGHAGINDTNGEQAACNSCSWQGPAPKEDRCPGCGKLGAMIDACPECGSGSYKTVAERTFGVGEVPRG